MASVKTLKSQSLFWKRVIRYQEDSLIEALTNHKWSKEAACLDIGLAETTFTLWLKRPEFKRLKTLYYQHNPVARRIKNARKERASF